MTASIDETRSLVDTNVVIYAYETQHPEKAARARGLLEGLSGAGLLVYSTQVLNEFCSVMMRPNRRPS